MADLEYPPILIGAGLGLQVAGGNDGTKKDREYVVGATGYATAQLPQALPVGFDELTKQFGSRVYESMLVDPVVGGSFELLKLGVLSTGLQLRPTVTPKDGEPIETDPRAVRAAEIKDFCERAIRSMAVPIEDPLFNLLDAMAYGNKIAELVCRVVPTGQDAGKLYPERIKVKPRETIRFVVDATGEVLAFQGRDADNGTEVLLTTEKFLWFSWQVIDGDPRGTSMLRCVADAWNLKIQTWPEVYAGLQQFGSPSLIGVTAEGEMDRTPEDADGNPIEGAEPVSPQAYLAQQLSKFKNGRSLAVPYGTVVTVLEAKGDGSIFRSAIELFDRQIVLGILKNTRTMLEAQHGSKADSETGQDVTGMTIRYAQSTFGECIRRRLIWRLVAWNFGEQVADEYTPHVTFGQTEHQDFAVDATAVGGLHRVGYLTESQLPAIDARLGLPVRKPGESRVQTAQSPPASGDGQDQQDPPPPPPKKGAKP